MRHESIFELNRLADEYEAKAKAYRAVANDLMNGTEHQSPVRKVGRPPNQTGKKYNGKHWMQNPKNKDKMMKMVRKMQKARKG